MALGKALGLDNPAENLYVYGSLGTGLSADPGTADLDVTFFTPLVPVQPAESRPQTPREQSHREHAKAQLRRVEAVLQSSSGYSAVQFIVEGARVPVVTATSTTGRCVDITFANRHAVENSGLLRKLARFPIFPQFIRRVKRWAKEQNLVKDPANGEFRQYSSYTWTLMVGGYVLVLGHE